MYIFSKSEKHIFEEKSKICPENKQESRYIANNSMTVQRLMFRIKLEFVRPPQTYSLFRSNCTLEDNVLHTNINCVLNDYVKCMRSRVNTSQIFPILRSTSRIRRLMLHKFTMPQRIFAWHSSNQRHNEMNAMQSASKPVHCNRNVGRCAYMYIAKNGGC